MTAHELRLEPPLTEQAQIEELRRQTFFISEQIHDFTIRYEDGHAAVALTVETPEECDPVRLQGLVDAFVDREIRPLRGLPKNRLWVSPRDPATLRYHRFDALARAGLITEVQPGQVVLADGAIRLYRALDEAVVSRVTSSFEAVEHQYPVTLPLTVLQRSGYFGSFPQHVYFASRLKGELPVYEGLARASGSPDLGRLLLGSAATVEKVLPPTMCYHTFARFADSSVPSTLTCVTSRGSAFRHESRYHRTAERLSDFTIRETVFLGAPERVEQALAVLRADLLALAEELGLAGWCEQAHDPFFASGADANRADTQLMLDLKHELRVNVTATDSLAVASFNVHKTHFTDAFGIRGHGLDEPVHSACVGVGLERLVYAVLSQYGPDERRWPGPLRAAGREHV